MKSKFYLFLFSLGFAQGLCGQILMIDAAGTRGLGSVFGGAGADSHDFKFDSAKRSVNATYVYNYMDDKAHLYGLHVQGAVPDSWINLAKRNPNIELSGIFNTTWVAENKRMDYFVTFTVGAKGDDQQWRTSPTAPVQKSYDVTGQARLTFGIVPLAEARVFSGALTVGANRASNLADLKEVEVDGTKIREGVRVDTTVFPMTARLNIRLGQGVGRAIGGLLQLDAKTKRNAVAGIYGTVTPRNGGKPTHVAGLTLSLQEMVTPKDVAVPADIRDHVDPEKDLNYWKPLWTVYSEVSQPFGTGKSETTTGVAATFAWP